VKILITTISGQLLFQYDSFTEKNDYDNALVTGLISAIIFLGKEIVSAFPKEVEFEGKILYLYKEDDIIVALLANTDAPFNSTVLPLLYAKFQQIKEEKGFNYYDAIKHQSAIEKAIKSVLADYLSQLQQKMLRAIETTDLLDVISVIKLKTVAKDVMFNGEPEFLSFEVISRLIPDGFDKILYALTVGIPIIVTGNKNIVEPVVQSLRLLSPFRVLKTLSWSNEFKRGYDLVGMKYYMGVIPSYNLVVVNLDEGVVLGGRSSTYFKSIAKQLTTLSAMEAYTFLRSELNWLIGALEEIRGKKQVSLDLPFDKMLILFEFIKRIKEF